MAIDAVNNPQDAFIDNFHTCFVLKNLFKTNLVFNDSRIIEAIRRGYTFYRDHLLNKDGLPRAFAKIERFNMVKIELYDYAEGINLGVLLKDEIDGAFQIAHGMAEKVISDYQLEDGHFVTRVNMFRQKHTVPFMRWPQAQIFCALTTLAKAMTKCAE